MPGKLPAHPIKIVGGGPKKILYTLKTVSRIGLLNSAKALNSHNACKACGLGMGGQRGGMTNERDEFPSVCNKSIQAQSTDIQPAIPLEVFDHPLRIFSNFLPMSLSIWGGSIIRFTKLPTAIAIKRSAGMMPMT